MNNQPPVKTSFWNFKDPKSYSNPIEIILDILMGLFIPSIPIRFFSIKYLSFAYEQMGEIDATKYSYSINLSTLIPLFVIVILLILGVFYFWKRRKYLAYGLLFEFIFYIFLLILLLH